jgi:hypothetical protein
MGNTVKSDHIKIKITNYNQTLTIMKFLKKIVEIWLLDYSHYKHSNGYCTFFTLVAPTLSLLFFYFGQINRFLFLRVDYQIIAIIYIKATSSTKYFPIFNTFTRDYKHVPIMNLQKQRNTFNFPSMDSYLRW